MSLTGGGYRSSPVGYRWRLPRVG